MASQYNCTIRRDARSLEWKIDRGDAVMTAVERDGVLVGVVVSRKKGDRQWIICDLLAADAGEALTMTLVAAINVANERALADPTPAPLRKVGVLATPLMVPTLAQLGFKRDDYDFPLAVHLLDPSISKTEVAREQWYVSADDVERQR